jgi:cell division protease FtsH
MQMQSGLDLNIDITVLATHGDRMGRITQKKYFAATIVVLIALASSGLFYLRQHVAASASRTAIDSTIQQMRKHPGEWKAEKDVSGLLADFKANNIAAIGISSSAVLVTTRNGSRYFVTDYAARISGSILSEYEKVDQRRFQLAVLTTEETFSPLAFPLALGASVLGLGLYLIFGKYRLFDRQAKSFATFDDVIGAEEAKRAFAEIADYLCDPQKYADFGARPPKGILLVGPPGGGKTHLARALAGETKAGFLVITGSEFSSMFYGVGIRRVKSIFAQAKRKSPCILFIDEIDGIGQRTKVERASDAEPNRIINQILTEMDGFHAANGVIVIGATNKPDALDEAMIRPGRFDRKIHVNVPGVEDRKALFEYYAGKLKSTEPLDFVQLARVTTGFTPAAISSIVNTAALSATKQGSASLKMCHLFDAVETESIGEVTSAGKLLKPAERRRIAVHEAGHALMTRHLNTGTLEKVTILPRGPSLGVTMVTPHKETEFYLRSELEHRIQMLLGGRVAEKLVFGDMSSGAAGDLTEASTIAFKMVAELGMSKDGKLFSLGACRKLGLHTDHLFYLDQTQELLDEMEAQCMQTLDDLKPALDQLVEMLLEREDVPGEEVAALLETDPVLA